MTFITITLFIILTVAVSSSSSKKAGAHSHNTNIVYQTYRKPNFSTRDRPNIILILTDDQDTELGSLKFMPKLNRLLRDEGVSYENGYVTTPMCCPSRSSLLTGLYVHNHHVFTNNENCSSTYWVENHEKRTFATYLQQSGYTTGYFGKYLNKYDGQRVPPGWDKWNGLIKNSAYYNYNINNDGVKRNHGSDYSQDYLPDLITNRTLKFLSKVSQAGKFPFLAVMSYPAPHGPEDSAPQHQHLFFNVTTHRTPAYDFAPNPDKEWVLRATEKMLPVHRTFTDILQTKRLQTLQSVDDGLEQVIRKLEQLGELERTYVFYTSDHGYHLGQFGLVKGKSFPYEFDTKVPFLVRGPGVTPQSVRSHPVLNIDLAPTFLDIAGLEKPPHMDGRSILPTIRKPNKKLRHSFLIERGKMTFEKYAKKSYNSVLSSDEDMALLKKNKLTKQERLEVECRKAKYQPPCDLGQRWVCTEKAQGTKRISRCSSLRLRSLEKFNKCHCLPGETIGLKYKKLEMSEKKMQKRFLKQNLKDHQFKHLNTKFLKTVPAVLSRRGRSVEDGRLSEETFLTEMADDEIKEVDLLVEDIAEEIRDLKNSSSSAGGCKVSAEDEILCSASVTADRNSWETSRTSIRQQMDQLRKQLKQLKQIRKFLASKNPSKRPRDSAVMDQDNTETCLCDSQEELKEKIRSERENKRLKRKLLKLKRKEIKRKKIEKKSRRKAKKADHCKSEPKMNCFSHDNQHWKTEPRWTGGAFCACTNSNNNTYWCVRNINVTHNYLYCEYVTGMMTYYDMRVDPHQLRNLLHSLTDSELNFMHQQVRDLRDFSAERKFWERKRRIEDLRTKEKLRKQKRKKRRESVLKWKKFRKNISRIKN